MMRWGVCLLCDRQDSNPILGVISGASCVLSLWPNGHSHLSFVDRVSMSLVCLLIGILLWIVSKSLFLKDKTDSLPG